MTIIHITTQGDPSVGIGGDDITLMWNIVIRSQTDRDNIRINLRKFFKQICDNGETLVWYDDECPDCHTILINNKCENKSCISHK